MNLLRKSKVVLCHSHLRRTKACQPAMYVAGLAAVEKLRAEKPEKATGDIVP